MAPTDKLDLDLIRLMNMSEKETLRIFSKPLELKPFERINFIQRDYSEPLPDPKVENETVASI